MALSSVKKAFTAKPSYAGDPNCDFLAEACRRATAKNAYHPDENLKALIVNKINETTPGAQVPIKVTYDIIRRRLQMENPHKQWLAVDLTRHLLSASKERLRPYRTELLYHVARVAIKPNKKGPITAQHNARKAATDYLHQCGDEGQDALRMARMQLGNLTTQSMSMAPMGGFGQDGFGAPGMPYSTVPPSQHSPQAKDNGNAQARIANVQQPTGDVMKDVRNLIDTAESHSNVLNELILASSEEQRESNAPLLAELKQEMLQVKDMFPRLLEQLSMLKTPGSEALMAQALEAHEQIDQCLDMERQYAEGLQAEAELAKDREAGHLRDEDDDDEEDVEEGEEGADGTKDDKEEKGDQGEGSPSGAAVSPQGPEQPAAPAFDLLNFDSGPLPPAGASTSSAVNAGGEQQSEDLFGLGALQTNLPSPGGATATAATVAAPSTAGVPPANDDPFMSQGLADQSNANASPSQPPSSNPFAMQPQGSTPLTAPTVDTSANPFGTNAFGQPSPGAAAPAGSPGAQHGGSYPQGQGFPGNPIQQPQQRGGFAYSGPPPGQGQPMQFPHGPGAPGPYGSSSMPPGQFGGPPVQGTNPHLAAPPGHGMPGQFMGGQTGPQGMQPQQPGFQMYGQQQGWGNQGQAAQGHPFGNSAFPGPQGGHQQQFPPGQNFSGPAPGQYGAMQGGPAQQQFTQTAPMQGFGGPPAANPFAPQQQVPMQQMPGQFAGGATGFPQQQPNPFAATSTGYVPPWNPQGQKDAFVDLIHEHNKRTNSTPPMSAPMRAQGSGPNGLL